MQLKAATERFSRMCQKVAKELTKDRDIDMLVTIAKIK